MIDIIAIYVRSWLRELHRRWQANPHQPQALEQPCCELTPQLVPRGNSIQLCLHSIANVPIPPEYELRSLYRFRGWKGITNPQRIVPHHANSYSTAIMQFVVCEGSWIVRLIGFIETVWLLEHAVPNGDIVITL
jgi:hypothetical protein